MDLHRSTLSRSQWMVEVWCHSFMLLMRQENRTWHIDSNVVLVCSRGLCSVLEGLHCSVPVRTTHKCDRCVYMQEFEVLMGSKDTVLHGHIMIESYCWWKKSCTGAGIFDNTLWLVPNFQCCVLKLCAPVQDFSHSTSLFWGHFLFTNVKWGARGSRLQVLLVVQDFFHQPYQWKALICEHEFQAAFEF